MNRWSVGLAAALATTLSLSAALADHGAPSTREAMGTAAYDPKPAASTQQQEVADHQVQLSVSPEGLRPGRLVRFSLTIRQKSSGETYAGDLKLAVRPAGVANEATTLAAASSGDSWSALFVFDKAGPYEVAMEFTPLPGPGSASLQITKKTVLFPLEVPGEAKHSRLPLIGGLALVGATLLGLSLRKR